MTYKKGIRSLKKYINYEKDWAENPNLNHGDYAVINQKNFNIRNLEEILQDFESKELELKIAFRAPLATELPNLSHESFQEEGIRIKGKGGIFTASAESFQSEFVSFLIFTSINVVSASIIIANLLHKKLQNLKNTKCRIGDQEIDSATTLDRIREMISEELERVKEEDFED